MIFKDTNLKDAKLITTFVQNDCRGSFIKDFHYSEFMAHNINFVIKEEMETISKRGVIRGMHFQLYKPQAKLVRCIKGKIFDYIVDARKIHQHISKGRVLFYPRKIIIVYMCPKDFYTAI